MEIGGGAFGNLAGALVRLIVQAAGAAVMVVMSWQFLKVLFTGGSERAIRGLVVNLVVIGICIAALANPAQTAGIVQAVGQAVWGAVAEAVRASV